MIDPPSVTYSKEDWLGFALAQPEHLLVGEVGEAFVALLTGGRWLKIPPRRRGDNGQDVLTPRGWFLQVKTVSRDSHEFVDEDPEKTARRAHLTMDVHVNLDRRFAQLRGWVPSPHFAENHEEYRFGSSNKYSRRLTANGRAHYQTGSEGLERLLCRHEPPWGLGSIRSEWPSWPQLLDDMRGK